MKEENEATVFAHRARQMKPQKFPGLRISGGEVDEEKVHGADATMAPEVQGLVPSARKVNEGKR